MPWVRALKMGFLRVRVSYSSRRFGKTLTSSSTASFHPSGRSAATPPMRNQDGCSRPPVMSSTMSRIISRSRKA